MLSKILSWVAILLLSWCALVQSPQVVESIVSDQTTQNSTLSNDWIHLINSLKLDEYSWTMTYPTAEYYGILTWSNPASQIMTGCSTKLFNVSWYSYSNISLTYSDDCEYVGTTRLIQNYSEDKIMASDSSDGVYPIITIYKSSWTDGMDTVRKAIQYHQYDRDGIWLASWSILSTGNCDIIYSPLLSTWDYMRYVVLPSPVYSRYLSTLDINGPWDYCGWFGPESTFKLLQVDRRNPSYVLLVELGQDIPFRNANSLIIN